MRKTSSHASSSTGRALPRYAIMLARNDSMPSTEVTWARSAMLTLVQIFFDALRLAEEIRHVLIGHFRKLFQCLYRLLEFVGELVVLLVLPRIAERGKTGLKRAHPILQVAIEALEFLGKTPHLFGVHD